MCLTYDQHIACDRNVDYITAVVPKSIKISLDIKNTPLEGML